MKLNVASHVVGGKAAAPTPPKNFYKGRATRNDLVERSFLVALFSNS